MKNKRMKKAEKDFYKELGDGRFRVTLFGSARVKKNSKIYRDVKQLAKDIGERGFDLVTGGGPGLMEAASAGHKLGSKKNKARTIGVGIRLPSEQKFNKHLAFKKEYKRFSKRLDTFMMLSNVVVVAPGGVGTMLELFYTWQLVQVEQICDTPIILLGKQWPYLIKWLKRYPLKEKFLDKEDINLLIHAEDCDEAMKMIDKSYKEYEKGGEDFCSNYKKYKLLK